MRQTNMVLHQYLRVSKKKRAASTICWICGDRLPGNLWWVVVLQSNGVSQLDPPFNPTVRIVFVPKQQDEKDFPFCFDKDTNPQNDCHRQAAIDHTSKSTDGADARFQLAGLFLLKACRRPDL
jgi:hypothetical protein